MHNSSFQKRSNIPLRIAKIYGICLQMQRKAEETIFLGRDSTSIQNYAQIHE